jgi:hypothetical protein
MATFSLLAGLVLCFPIPGHADYKEDIGFTALSGELGGSRPTGSGVTATQVEARTSYNPLGPYMPDPTNSQFTGKTLTKKTSDSVSGSSGHATTVGQYFYGSTFSLSPGIVNVDCYETNDYIGLGFLHHGYTFAGKPFQPGYTMPSDVADDQSSPSRVANHSWVGTANDNAADSDILRRLDFVVETDEFIQIAAPNNGSSNRSLLASSFNAISFGRTDGCHPSGTVALDSQYGAGRTKPDLVVPLTLTSYTNPLGASSVGMLLQVGSNPSLATDPTSTFTTNRDGDRIYNGERSEVIKASLMAGAVRVTCNTTDPQIMDYRFAESNRSSNGLDKRYGSGQLNVYHSYHIIATGEQNSAEDCPAGAGSIGWYGFDYDPFFGGNNGSNGTSSYYFTIPQGDTARRMLFASLVWNIDIHGGTWNNFNSTATLYNLDLQLHDITDPQSPRLVGTSQSTVDNTENLWVPLSPGRSYRLQVVRGQGQVAFQWDYALAWRMVTPVDTDQDGMPDDWEVYFGLSCTSSADGEGDVDADGLVNSLEYLSGTNPTDPDSDDDGFMDGAEYNSGSDPLDPDSLPPASEVPAMSRAGLVAAALVVMLAGLSKARWNGNRV